MWMMGCSDAGDFGIPESFNGRKLRPLMPRTPMGPSNHGSSPPRLRSLHGNDIFSLNHHLAASMGDQSKKEFHTQQVVVSSRWNPTPEQLRTLEELYRRGTRTPSTEQIQHITAQLRRYGKIEGKNVFYWFQNHKARERQKRRRQMESSVVCTSDNEHNQHHHHQQQHQQQQQLDIEMFERKEQEGEEIKNSWALSTNCSTLAEESISTQRAAEKARNVTELCREREEEERSWYPLDDQMEFQNRNINHPKNATWHHMMNLSSDHHPTHHHQINTTSPQTFPNFNSALTSPPKITTIRTSMDPKHLIKTNIFIAPYYSENGNLFNFEEDKKNGCGESQTLELFPLCSSKINEGKHLINGKEIETSTGATMNVNFTPPSRFFEFLPLKN